MKGRGTARLELVVSAQGGGFAAVSQNAFHLAYAAQNAIDIHRVQRDVKSNQYAPLEFHDAERDLPAAP